MNNDNICLPLCLLILIISTARVIVLRKKDIGDLVQHFEFRGELVPWKKAAKVDVRVNFLIILNINPTYLEERVYVFSICNMPYLPTITVEIFWMFQN